MLKLFLTSAVLLKVCQLSASVEVTESDENLTLENGYTKVSFNKQLGHIDSIISDFTGAGKFGENILSDSFGLEVKKSSELCQKNNQAPQISWINSVEGCVSARISNLLDCASDPTIAESWKISLCDSQRSIDISVDGEVLSSASVLSVSHSLYLKTVSIYGLFDRGVAQMMNKEGGCLGSSENMNRTYFLGECLFVDIFSAVCLIWGW